MLYIYIYIFVQIDLNKTSIYHLHPVQNSDEINYIITPVLASLHWLHVSYRIRKGLSSHTQNLSGSDTWMSVCLLHVPVSLLHTQVYQPDFGLSELLLQWLQDCGVLFHNNQAF